MRSSRLDTSSFRRLSRVEREALMIRHAAALRLLRSDPELTPEDALALVLLPSNRLREETEAEAARRIALAEGCHRCGSGVDEDGFCSMCGEVTLLAVTP